MEISGTRKCVFVESLFLTISHFMHLFNHLFYYSTKISSNFHTKNSNKSQKKRGHGNSLSRPFWLFTSFCNLLPICSTGCTDTTTKDSTTSSQSAPAPSKLFSTATSSTSMLPKLSKARKFNCLHKI